RLQDFRHLCATKILVRWYRAGEDAERRLPELSAYLGHVHVSDTFWYLSGAPSSWNKRLGGWKNAGRHDHETTAQLPRPPGELLHPTPGGSTAGQPTHYRFLSGHLPLAAELCAKAAP